jgi:predicted nucleic acid-binding protein
VGKRFLIDTNVLLEYIGKVLPPSSNITVDKIISEDFNISVINRIEVLGHPSANKDIIDFLDLAKQYELTKAIVDQTIALRKVHKIKLPDAVIAATAIFYNLTLVSRNTKDFENINGLEVINPYNF